MAQPIQITINSKQTTTTAETLFSLMEKTGVTSEKAVAVALNQEVIGREDWQQTKLHSEDAILIIKPTQGG